MKRAEKKRKDQELESRDAYASKNQDSKQNHLFDLDCMCLFTLSKSRHAKSGEFRLAQEYQNDSKKYKFKFDEKLLCLLRFWFDNIFR